jgi:hypothetical protein
MGATVMHYLLETPEVVGRLLEVGHALTICNIPKCADKCQKRRLPGAVIPDDQGERS